MADIMDHPLISISIINLNGNNYLNDCLGSLDKLDYPKNKIEILVVDNGSTDDSVKFVKDKFPLIKIIQNNKNNGFAKANNQAAELAKGEYIAFLNNDTKVDKNWIIELLKPIYKNREVVASGSKVLSFDGNSLDFVGGMINFEGKGFQVDYGKPVKDDNYKVGKFLPFVNGGAMMIN
ncbi:MAG: glycosyltransferase, partial [Candidatus Humimicrobiaceae bacterium]